MKYLRDLGCGVGRVTVIPAPKRLERNKITASCKFIVASDIDNYNAASSDHEDAFSSGYDFSETRRIRRRNGGGEFERIRKHNAHLRGGVSNQVGDAYLEGAHRGVTRHNGIRPYEI